MGEWKETFFGKNEEISLLGSGIDKFSNKKEYLSTASIQGESIKNIESDIAFDVRPSRANMQPVPNSIWFARMKGTFKIQLFDSEDSEKIKRFILSTGFAGMKVNEKIILPKYAYYYLASPQFNIVKDKLGTGSTQVAITNGNIKQIPFKYPVSIIYQGKIINEIEKNYTRLNSTIESLQTIKKKLEVYRKSVLNFYFQKKKPTKSNIEINELVDNIRYGTSKKCYVEKKGIPILRIPNIVKGFVDQNDLKYCSLSADEKQKLSLKEGDILIIRSNGSRSLVGRSAIITKNDLDCSYAGYLIKISLNKNLIFPPFFNYFFQSGFFRHQVEKKAKSTSGVNNINAQEIKSMKINLFSLEEQEKMVQEIESKFSIIDKLEETVNASLLKAETLRKSILKSAFEGKLVRYDDD